EIVAARLPGERVEPLAAVCVDVDAGERLAHELVGGDLAGRVDCGAHLVHGGGAFRIPACALVAHILQTDRLSDAFREYGGVHGTIIGIVAAVRAGSRLPDHANAFGRHADRRCEALLHEVRFLRARPARNLAILDFNQSAGRPHTRVRLEWPFVFGFDHLRGGLECFIDTAVFFFDVALAYAGLADVVVQRGL